MGPAFIGIQLFIYGLQQLCFPRFDIYRSWQGDCDAMTIVTRPLPISILLFQY